MTPWRVGLSTGCTDSTPNSKVLLERHAYHDVTPGDPAYLSACRLKISDVFEHFCAKHAIEKAIGEIQAGNVSSDGCYTRNLPGRLFQIERCNLRENLCQQAGEMAVAGADIE